ncbi:10272_t:CDS:2, partial [Entrophospora sp. SA101]
MVVGNTVKLMLPVETKKQKITEEGTGVAMDIQSDGSDSRRRKEPKPQNNEGSKEKQKADITFGQLFQAAPKLTSELSRSLRTPQTRRVKKTTPQAEQLNAEIRSTAMYCKANKLGVKIPRKSSVVIINVNGQKTSPLGEVDDLPLTIGGITIPLSAI